MDFVTIMAAGVATGTIYLFAAVGEIFAERSGGLNLGVTGMMLMGAGGGFATVVATGDPWLRPLGGAAAARASRPPPGSCRAPGTGSTPRDPGSACERSASTPPRPTRWASTSTG